MLVLVGLGLHDEMDISLKGLEQIKKSDKVYAEVYTNLWKGDIKKLEELTGKEIIKVKRKDLENEIQKILEEAKIINVAILVPGDPLVATSHYAILEEAKKIGIETKVIHASSIFSAICETGIRITQLGQTITIPLPKRTMGKLPKSVYEAIKENRKRKLKTLCLLDIDIENDEFLSVSDALKILLNLEEKFNEKVVSRLDQIIVFSDVGGSSKIFKGSIEDALKEDFELPSVIIL